MFFTQDDYKKIQQWLIKNSVRDTEFNEANIPFNGNEIVSIVQGNQNKKVFLKDLVSQIFNLGVSDFVNITDKYDAPNISLEEAIRLIPSRARKVGQVITFVNEEGHWHIYQFRGALNQWNTLDKWEDLFDWEKLISNLIIPDEEDLTKSLPYKNGNSYLSLKDRAYNPGDFSGLGRVILRKNIVEIEDPIYGIVKKNILTQDMINKSNTIYEIKYDFDLAGKEITILEGCVLDFQGGSLNNGSIKGNILNEYLKPEWFGAKGDSITDDTNAVICCINLASENNIDTVFAGIQYNIAKAFKVGCGIIGKGFPVLKYSGIEKISTFLELAPIQDVKITGVKIDGNNLAGRGIYMPPYYNHVINTLIITSNYIQNIKGENQDVSAILIIDEVLNAEVNNNVINNVRTESTSGTAVTGIALQVVSRACNISNNTVSNITTKALRDADGIEVFTKNRGKESDDLSATVISNNSVSNCSGRFVKIQGSGVSVINNTFTNIGTEIITSATGVDSQTDGCIIKNNKFIIKNLSLALSSSARFTCIKQAEFVTTPAFRDINTSIKDNTLISDGYALRAFIDLMFETVDVEVNINIDNNLANNCGTFIRWTGNNINKKFSLSVTNNIFNGYCIINVGDITNLEDEAIYTKCAENIIFNFTNNKGSSRHIFDNKAIAFYKVFIDNNEEIEDGIYGYNWNVTKLGGTTCYYISDNNGEGLKGLPDYALSYNKNVYIKGTRNIGSDISVSLYKPDSNSIILVNDTEDYKLCSLDNIFVVIKNTSNNEFYANTLKEWLIYKNAGWYRGELPEGVMVIEGDKNIIVACNSFSSAWSSSPVPGGGNTTKILSKALRDFNGECNTSRQLNVTECNNENSAIYICNNYETPSIEKGQWWCPSVGQAMILFKNLFKINYVLSYIDGSAILSTYNWTSTENDDNYAWAFNFSAGNVARQYKGNVIGVKPITTLGGKTLLFKDGNVEERPVNIEIGYQYFDTTLNKPIWWTGSKWIDATGANV